MSSVRSGEPDRRPAAAFSPDRGTHTAHPAYGPAPEALSHPPRNVTAMHLNPAAAATEMAGEMAGSAAERGAAGGILGREAGDDSQRPVGGTGVPATALSVLDVDPAQLDLVGLEEFLVAVRAVRSWVDAREAAALAVATDREVAREVGAVDTAAWLGQNTGVGRREALARTRTAAGLEDLPEVSTALCEGRVTHSHAQALIRYAAPDGVDLDVDPAVDFPDPARDAARQVAVAVREQQDELVTAAEAMSADAFRRFLRRWADRAAGDDGAGRDAAQRRRRSVVTFATDDGMRGVRGLLPADRFAFFENELRRLAETHWRADHPDADNVPARELTCPQRNADALVDMARRSRQLADDNDESLGSHVDVMVLIDYETLTSGTHDEGRCELDDTTPLSPTAARRMLCDADIITAITHRHGWKLDLGYSRRAANRKLRKALIARDRTCTAPGCERPHWMCEIHHIVPWSEGGRTDLDNLTLLCGRHHHLHHAAEARGAAKARRPTRACTTKRRNRPPDYPPGDGGSEHGSASHLAAPRGGDSQVAADPGRPPPEPPPSPRPGLPLKRASTAIGDEGLSEESLGHSRRPPDRC